jgi:hypothetical protein
MGGRAEPEAGHVLELDPANESAREMRATVIAERG